MSLNIKSNKCELRKKFLNKRKMIFDSISEKIVQTICKKAFAVIQNLKPEIVGCYLPINSEVNTYPLIKLLENHSYKICLPQTPLNPSELVFKIWSSNHKLKFGPFGTLEPLRSAKVVIPDLMIVPLIAFDNYGNRLGYGGGYYDRTIKKIYKINSKLITIGLAFEEQRCQRLPIESFDVPLKILVHNKKIIYFKDDLT